MRRIVGVEIDQQMAEQKLSAEGQVGVAGSGWGVGTT